MAERIVTLCFLLGSSIYLFGAQQLTFGTIDSPKSGFLPNLAGLAGIVLAIVLLIVNRQCLSKPVKQDMVDWTKFIFVIIGLIVYITVLNIIGYLAAAFIFLLYLFKVADTGGWLVPVAMAGSCSVIFYLVFGYYLAVTLP
ncbi:tripartite tricarboxylate transporter TctB family protein [Sporomusa termitida]|uniref:Tripartite tricarboxylate transporter TctB family protein n=1 Tax=Sporomusa termitida TaxID=2377 RepID=A0A517DQ01_9FIRM|nr:tripartite tricarboxylate transporter TctB family protein [Sporomusa termitida]QDR79444.1 Tripartite tricarboxylate transporter TctB family protein [Sporomusa termitida]